MTPFSKDQRALVFIDGPNLYNRIKDLGLRPKDYDPCRIAHKIVQDRILVGIRYYRAQIDRSAPPGVRAAYDGLTVLLHADPSTTVVEGYIQCLTIANACAAELLEYLAHLPAFLPNPFYQDLRAIAGRHQATRSYHEKGVDVQLAVDLVALALADRYDVAYLLSGDGDFAPAVSAARTLTKRIIIASPNAATRLRTAADFTIRLRKEWFADCVVAP